MFEYFFTQFSHTYVSHIGFYMTKSKKKAGKSHRTIELLTSNAVTSRILFSDQLRMRQRTNFRFVNKC